MKDATRETDQVRKNRQNLSRSLGAQLKKARTEKGSSVEAFAVALGLLPSQLTSIEQGLLRISAGAIYDAALLCNKPIDYFFSGPELVYGARPS